jgi:hypothetical protein
MDQELLSDEALVHRLRADLDSFVGDADLEPPVLTAGSRRRTRTTPRRVMIGLAAASVVALVVGLANIGPRDDAGSAPSDGPEPGEAAGASLPVPPTPDGWTVVEWGDVRLSVPPELSPFDAANGCGSSNDGATMWIECEAGSVTVRLSTEPGDGRGVVLNGLEVTRRSDAITASRVGAEVMVEVAVDRIGASVDDVLDTVGVSSRWRADNEPAPPVPPGWVPVELGGIRMMVPPDWPVVELDPQGADPDVCGFAGLQPGVLVGRGVLETPVDCSVPPAIFAPSDGVRIFELDPELPSTDPPGAPLVDLRMLGSDGGSTLYRIRIGFGVDGTIGRTILGSVAVPVTPGTTAPPPIEDAPRTEAIGTVLESPDHGPQLCLGGVLDSLPPQCSGPDLVGWTWDAIDGEQSASGTTWVEAYVTGRFDPATYRFAVDGARAPTQDDRDRLDPSGSVADDDFGVPCPAPAGGWPARRQEWPGDQIAAIDGYAGSWTDPSQQVMVVKFTGDLADAEQAVRTYYSGALCVIAGEHTEAELRSIQEQLMALSSEQVLWTSVTSDLRGEWVEAGIVAPAPDLQSALDAEYGEGVVRLVPALRPLDG